MKHDKVQPRPAPLPSPLIEQAVTAALNEDLGLVGDITTNATVGADTKASAVIAARRDGIISGLDVAAAAFLQVDPKIEFTQKVSDGDTVRPGMVVAEINGPARGILTGERVALNYLGRMSGIATLTRAFVIAIDGTGARIVDTRKTTPGLRAFEKYAVRCGGGHNHRTGLFDAVLIKDNHIVAAGGLASAVARARTEVGHMVKIEVEVDTMDQLKDVLEFDIDAVLLDNMPPEILKKAVNLVKGRCLTEASGGITLNTVRAIADSGVNMISIGALTHSAPVLDLGLDFKARRLSTKSAKSA